MSKDKFDIHLDEMIEKVKSCQESNSLKSCSNCDKFLECDLRDEYVKSAYDSMSKGQDGGFEF
ncbi:hypothetical protein [Campylobacter corcagiensis]|uniref:Uncharacterized protein n=1 Tax=Campylobacter corcagiensis TaxID=1448857 RepID=A0A7M1LHZ6_9BACT|nr:hypothetical protein [Campylobacter corcagiensis]QKF64954.1 hypothetical protein CCORG_1105 [Campylobacter corcagiensis]QOQ88198.1 hypothetical protein IMC76_06640 [Campylobacter corcagiensis]